jgi:hypothetical protein
LSVLYSCGKKDTPVKNNIWNLISITGNSETIRTFTTPGYNSKQVYTYSFASLKTNGSFQITEDVFSGKQVSYSYSFVSNIKDTVNGNFASEHSSTSGDSTHPESKISVFKKITVDSVIFNQGTFIKTPLPIALQTTPTSCQLKIENNKMTIVTVTAHNETSVENGATVVYASKATTYLVLKKQ